MSQRESFLARVRQAVEQGCQYRVHLKPVPEGIGYLGADGDVCARFAAEVNAVGGQALIVNSLEKAAQQLRLLLTEAAARSAVCWQHDVLKRLRLSELLAEQNVRCIDYDQLTQLPPNQQRQRCLDCDVGITSCDWAIAETGTLVMRSLPGQERLASLIAPRHIAIVERTQIVPDLIDATNNLAAAGPDDMPSNVTLITGPSKTGDIELQLTTGVHGPGKWHVIVVQ